MKPQLIDVDLANSTANNIQPLIKPAMDTPLGDDWLRAMADGSVFLAERKVNAAQQAAYVYDEYYLLLKSVKSVWLLHVGANQKFRVNSLKFSRQNNLVELLGVVTQDEAQVKEEQENDDEQRNRTDTPA